jgi:hypothetical protein
MEAWDAQLQHDELLCNLKSNRLIQPRRFMMFHRPPFIIFVCGVIVNTDVSGIGVRFALYLQAALSVLMQVVRARGHCTGIIASNIAIQVASVALVLAAYLDNSIDGPHAIIASQLAVLLSASRVTVYDVRQLSNRWRITCQILILDCVCRLILVLFNLHLWGSVLALQKQTSRCKEGFGTWVVFDIATESPATKIAYWYAWLDFSWTMAWFLTETIRAYTVRNSSDIQLKRELKGDPRLWLLRRIFPCLSRNRFTSLSTCSTSYKMVLWVITVVTVEITIAKNRIGTGENKWTFGQIVVMINLVAVVAAVAKPLATAFAATRLFDHIRNCGRVKYAHISMRCILVLSGALVLTYMLRSADGFVLQEGRSRGGYIATFLIFLFIPYTLGLFIICCMLFVLLTLFFERYDLTNVIPRKTLRVLVLPILAAFGPEDEDDEMSVTMAGRFFHRSSCVPEGDIETGEPPT